MAIKDAKSTPPGTHPSFASNLIIVECDKCGQEVRADVCVDDRYEFHGDVVGNRDGGEDFCAECSADLYAD